MTDQEVMELTNEQLYEKIKELEERELNLERKVLIAENESLQLKRTTSQFSLIRILFIGLFVMLILTTVLALQSQWVATAQAETLKMFLQFLERLLLVLAGIASTQPLTYLKLLMVTVMVNGN